MKSSTKDAHSLVFTGIWRLWTGERKGETGEHRLFAFLATSANDVVRPIHAKAMPVSSGLLRRVRRPITRQSPNNGFSRSFDFGDKCNQCNSLRYYNRMPDEVRHDTSDTARPSATRYTLSLEETALRFTEAGLPRNIRSLQRYCAAGRLDCIKEETVSGLAYFVDPDSVKRAITQLTQLHGITDEVRHGASVHNMSHTVAADDQSTMLVDTPRPSAADRDNDAPEKQERQSPPQPDVSQYVARLESENVFLRDQIGVKDTQIAALLERDKETNFLIRGLQTMLAPLLGTGERRDPPEHRAN